MKKDNQSIGEFLWLLCETKACKDYVYILVSILPKLNVII